MNRICFLQLVLGVVVSCVNPQPKVYADYSKSSGYDSTATDRMTIANLEVLGRVWGYAKYHHPIFADSTLNIDYELFELLPKVALADKLSRNKILCEWVDGLGEFENNKSYYQKYLDSAHVFINNYEWTSDTSLLGGKLSGLLKELRYAERDKNVYISQEEGMPIPPDGIKEDTYPTNSSLDTGFRLLQLFRFWNIIDSYCANRNITDKQWDSVLKEYILKMVNNEQYAVCQLVSDINDSHAFIYSSAIQTRSAFPVSIKFIDNKLIVVDTSRHHSLQIGDEIISVDEETPAEMIVRVKEYTSQSNNATLLRDVARIGFHTHQNPAQIEYIRKGRKKSANVSSISGKDASIYRNKGINRPKEVFRMLADSVGYIHIGALSLNDSDKIMDALKKTKAVVVDIRCYPSESVNYPFFGKNFFATPAHYVTWKIPLVIFPGYIMLNEHKMGVYEGSINLKENPDAYAGKVIILVNEEAQSAPETIAMSLQARPNTITVGSQTAGANGNVVTIPLPGNLNSIYSGIGVLYPDGTDAQRIGVRIDVEVRPTIDGIKAGRDEVLEKALELID